MRFALTLALLLGACQPALLTNAPSPTPSAPSAPSAGALDDAVRSVVEKAKPAVVQVTNEQVALDQLGRPQSVPAGTGSGFIYDGAGHVLTNHHVIAGASRLRVTLVDGRTFPATLVGSDPLTDLAVLKVEAAGLPTIELGASSELLVGEWVVAIGNALALPGGPTVTVGVVSALGRTIQEPQGPALFDLVQTDAAINPGNSGGPLVDLSGRVVGINTVVARTTATGIPVEGIGFAIAIDTARPIADELVRSGRIDHAYLGVAYTPLTPAIREQLGVATERGAVVTGVAPDSPAADAGLEPGDVIVGVGGEDVGAESDLARLIRQHAPGDTVPLTVQRGSRELAVEVVLGSRPSS